MLSREQRILINYVRTLVGANPTYAFINFMGAVAGSEFLTYNAKKLYIAFELTAAGSLYTNSSAYVRLQDQANVQSLNVGVGQNTYWNTTTPGPVRDNLTEKVELKNVMFSRVIFSAHTEIKFIGIKVTWP